MALRRKPILRHKVEVEPVEDDEELEDDGAEVEVEEDDDLDELDIDRDGLDEEDEEEPEPVKPTRKAVAPAPAKLTVRSARTVAPVEAPAPVKAKTVAKKAEAPVAEQEVEEAPAAAPVVIKKLADQQIGNVLTLFLDSIQTGQTLHITRKGDDSWTVSVGAAGANQEAEQPKNGKSSGGLRGQAFNLEVCTPEYLEFQARWQEMDAAAKAAEAKKVKATWEVSENPMINNMAMTAAVQKALGIEKYKPQYQSRAARAAVKG